MPISAKLSNDSDLAPTAVMLQSSSVTQIQLLKRTMKDMLQQQEGELDNTECILHKEANLNIPACRGYAVGQ